MCCMNTTHETEGSRAQRQGKRQSIALTARDLADLAMIRNSPEARRAVGITESMSETATLHALVAHSLRQAREAAEAAAYAELAADPEERELRAALRARGRRPRVDAE